MNTTRQTGHANTATGMYRHGGARSHRPASSGNQEASANSQRSADVRLREFPVRLRVYVLEIVVCEIKYLVPWLFSWRQFLAGAY